MTPIPQFNSPVASYITAQRPQELYIVADDVNKFDEDNISIAAEQQAPRVDYGLDNRIFQYSAMPVTHVQANKPMYVSAPTFEQFLVYEGIRK